MTADMKEIPLEPLQIVGFLDTQMVHIATYTLTDASKRQEVVAALLDYLTKESICIFGNTAIKTDRYDGFRII